MPAIQKTVSIASGATNPNIFDGSAFEFARTRTLVSLGANADGPTVFITINSGSDVVLEESDAYEAAQYPIVPDQMFYNDVMEAGDRLRVQVRNGSGATRVVRAIALLTPVA